MVNMLLTGLILNRLRGQDPDQALRQAALGAVVGNATAGITNPIARAVVGSELSASLNGRTLTAEDRSNAAYKGAVRHIVSGSVDNPIARALMVDALAPSSRSTPAARTSSGIDAAISTLHGASSPGASAAAGTQLGQLAASADPASKLRALSALQSAASQCWQARSVATFPAAVAAIAVDSTPAVQAHARSILQGWSSSWSNGSNRSAAASVLARLG